MQPKKTNRTTAWLGTRGTGALGGSASVSDPYLYHDERLLRHGFFVAWA